MSSGFQADRFISRCIESLQGPLNNARISVFCLGAAWLAACTPAKPSCDRCDLLVVAATGEPTTLLPPLVRETVGRDVSDFLYERLANLKPGGVPSDSGAYAPGLAASWASVDSTTWRFTLRPGATWHDGSPVTADDVVFSFAAYVDTALGAPAGGSLEGVTVTAESPGTVLVRFPRQSAEELLNATWSVRVLPKKVWDPIARKDWGQDTALSTLVGSGPFKITEWRRGQSLRIERVAPVANGLQQIVWRFASDQDAALNLVLAGEADLLETATSPAARARAAGDTTVVLRPYPSALYGFLGFRHRDPQDRPHPLLSARPLREALFLAIDRPTLVKAVLGPEAAVPAGPMSRALWLWSDNVTTAQDTVRGNRLLDSLGWARGSTGIRSKGGRRLAVDILVPSSSGVRRQLAEGIQQMWKGIGVDASITAVDFPVFQERLKQGRFDAMIGASLDEPSPRGLAEQWSKAGFGGPNDVRYDNPAFDSLTRRAMAAPTTELARAQWQAALQVLKDDVAAVFLYSPTNVAVATKRFASLPIDPFSWLSQAGSWRAPSQ